MQGFDNVVALFGMPRSGTTILSRLIANHGRVRKIIEPYHSRRDVGYAVSELKALCSDFMVVNESGFSLLVKETATRLQNIEYLAKLLENAHGGGHRTAYIYVLRSPLEAFLSQVLAANTLWKRKRGFERNKSALKSFWIAFAGSTGIYLEFAFRFHRRIVFYDAFVNDAKCEMGRIMGLFGYPLESGQMELGEDRSFGGDPEAGAGTMLYSPRHDWQGAIAELESEFRNVPEYEKMKLIHDYVKDSANHRGHSSSIIRDIAILVQKPQLLGGV